MQPQPRNARAEAQELVDPSLTVRVLEPSPPAIGDAEFFADDPAAVGTEAGRIVAPTSAGHVTWAELAEADSTIAGYASAHWLANYRRLGAVPDGYVQRREDCHRLAYSTVAVARMQANGKFGLRYTKGGFGTPFYGADEQVRVADATLVHQAGDVVRTAPITTLRSAGLFFGVEPSTDAAEHDSPALGDLDRALAIDEVTNTFLGDWFGFAFSVLEELRVSPGAQNASRVQLWPGHFDAALEIGDVDKGQRATYGLSPGDAGHDEPYLYVGAWGDVDRRDPYWNETSFNGASMPYGELVEATDQRATALRFFRAGLESVLGSG